MKFLPKQTIIAALIFGFCGQLFAAANPDLFPRPAGLEPAVQFWTKVFSEADTKHGYIHDDRYLGVIYEKIKLPNTKSRRKQQRYVNKVKKRYIKILKKLSKGRRAGLSAEEQRVLDLWPNNVSNKKLRKAMKRIRFQLGQSNKYREGLVRSGAWKKHILKTLDDMGLPREIASLPHVESSFNPKAWSRVGAAGLWQFTRSTGRRFMRIDHVIDERMDPFKASVAAARLLENNYAVTGTWPLALTAYNHGAAGMRNAAKQTGTTDILTIVNKYRSRSFKFASRNFYVAFLAAVDVEHNAEHHFGQVTLNPEVKDGMVKMPGYMAPRDVARALGVSKKYLKKKNPALRPAVWNGNKYIPRGYMLRFDSDKISGNAKKAIAKLASSKIHAKQKADKYHRIRRGQTLSTIATRYGVRVRDIVALNNLRSKHRIRAGQVLRLPQRSKRRGKTRVASARSVKYPVPLPKDGEYTIRRGDTITRIARRYGLKANQLLAYNTLSPRSRIYPGQTIRVTPQPVPEKTEKIILAKLEQPPVQNEPQAKDSSEVQKSGSDATQTALPDSSENTAPESTDAEKTSTTDGTGAAQQTLVSDLPADSSTQLSVAGGTEETSGNNSVHKEPIDLPALDTADDITSGSEQDSSSTALAATNGASAESAESIVSQVASVSAALTEVTQPELSADPSDYSVRKNNTIEIQAAETLGHYAEWLNLRASNLRRINKMRYGKPVVIGKRIKLRFNRVSQEEFEKQRIEYHRELQENFFEKFQIAGTKKHKIRRGDSVWLLAKRKYKIPVWLLRQYNPDLSFQKIQRGTIVTFPRLERRQVPATSAMPANNTGGSAERLSGKNTAVPPQKQTPAG